MPGTVRTASYAIQVMQRAAHVSEDDRRSIGEGTRHRKGVCVRRRYPNRHRHCRRELETYKRSAPKTTRKPTLLLGTEMPIRGRRGRLLGNKDHSRLDK